MRLYSVFDKVAQRYNTPYSEVNDAAAVRSFNLACRDSKSLLGMAPTDFALYFVGDFSDSLGEFVVPSAPVKVQDGRSDLND